MTKEAAQQLSIILDIIAFFLVTTDIYGKKRLKRLSLKIQNFKNSKFKKSFEVSQEELLKEWPTFFYANYFGLLAAYIYLCFFVGKGGRWILFFSTAWLIPAFVNLLFRISIYITEKFCLLISKKIIPFISRVGFLFPRMMLILGVILFILSKILVY